MSEDVEKLSFKVKQKKIMFSKINQTHFFFGWEKNKASNNVGYGWVIRYRFGLILLYLLKDNCSSTATVSPNFALILILRYTTFIVALNPNTKKDFPTRILLIVNVFFFKNK
jgi:hypothetical protein